MCRMKAVSKMPKSLKLHESVGATIDSTKPIFSTLSKTTLRSLSDAIKLNLYSPSGASFQEDTLLAGESY